MSEVIKPLGVEAVSNSTIFSSYGNNSLIRITHTGAVTSAALITCKDSTNTNILWTASILGGTTLTVQKKNIDLLTSNVADTSVLCVPVAYKN